MAGGRVHVGDGNLRQFARAAHLTVERDGQRQEQQQRGEHQNGADGADGLAEQARQREAKRLAAEEQQAKYTIDTPLQFVGDAREPIAILRDEEDGGDAKGSRSDGGQREWSRCDGIERQQEHPNPVDAEGNLAKGQPLRGGA